MLYFANPSTPTVREAMTVGHISMIATPKQGNRLPAGVAWCADNGCFGKGYPGDDVWLGWLDSYTPEERSRCLFATAPDVVGDAAETLTRSAPWLPRIRALGYRAAFVAQDGLEFLSVPWDSFDVLFLGGVRQFHYSRRAGLVATEWKTGPHARQLAREAKRRGKWVHMGRANSEKRIRYAEAIGCDSADGTYLAFGPDVNLPNVLAWMRGVNDQIAFNFEELPA